MGEPLYETVLAFQNYFSDGPTEDTGAVTVRAVEQQEQTGLPLVVSVAFPPGAVWIRVEYDPSRVDSAVAEWIADRYPALMTEIAAAAEDTPLSALAPADQPNPTNPFARADVPFGERVAIALADTDPAREPVIEAARAAGATIEFHDPVRPPATTPDTPLGSATAPRPQAPTAAPVVGAATAVTAMRTGKQTAAVVGAQTVPGAIPLIAATGTRVDRDGRPVPGPVPGEIASTGLWAREQTNGHLEFLGPKPGRP